MRFTLTLIALAVPSFLMGQSHTGAPNTTNDWLVVPGVLVGAITANTIRSDIRRLFPVSVVKDDELELEERFVLPATFVDRDTRSQSLAIVWSSPIANAHPKEIFLCRGRG